MIDRFQEMASQSKEILDDALKGQKALGLSRRLESAHLTFPLAGKPMRDFRAIVGAAFRVVRDLA